jgi:nucleotide-binding universal stress UspA family protein
MLPLERVTVGVDFSRGSKAALLHARRWAQADSATVHAVHVVDPLVLADLADAVHHGRDELRAEVEKSARDEWSRLVADWKPAPPDLKVSFESPVRGLVAESKAADLLIVGARSEPGGSGGVGAVASGCARRAPCSVLLAAQEPEGPFRRVCVGVDFSDLARRALDAAASVAARDGAELHVVHVFQAPWHELHYRAPTPEADPEFMRSFKGALDRLLGTFTEPVGGVVKPERLHRHLVDAPRHGAALVEFAKNRHADLLVVGAGGRRGLEDLILGTTAERVCREAPMSVLVARPKAGPR